MGLFYIPIHILDIFHFAQRFVAMVAAQADSVVVRLLFNFKSYFIIGETTNNFLFYPSISRVRLHIFVFREKSFSCHKLKLL